MNRSSARRIIRALVLGSLVALAPSAMHAQAVVPGDTVRITSFDWKYEGSLLSLDSAKLVMHNAKGDTLRFPLTDISGAEVLIERHRGGGASVTKGALIGLGVGTTISALILNQTHKSVESQEITVAFVALTTLATTIGGALIGGSARVPMIEHWERFDPHAPSAFLPSR
jgi:hypothetical protein